MKNIILTLFAAVTISCASFSQELSKYGVQPGTEGRGLAVDQTAPDFDAKNISGEDFNFYNNLRGKSIVLIFFRGAWCPMCNMHIAQIVDRAHEINEKNAEIVFITPDEDTSVAELKEKYKGDYTIVIDKKGEVIKAYDVAFDVTDDYNAKLKKYFNGMDLTQRNVQEKAQLVVPATYIVNDHGKIAYKQFDYNYSKRSSVDSILEAL